MTLLTHPAARTRSFEQAVEEFLSELEHANRSPHTLRAYKADLGAFGRYHGGEISLTSVSTRSTARASSISTTSSSKSTIAGCSTEASRQPAWTRCLSNFSFHSISRTTCALKAGV